MKQTAIFALFLSAICPMVSAQEPSFSTDTIAIESSRLGLTSQQMGRFVTVITSADIDRLPVRSLDELLRFLPGVEVQARGPFGTQADISMRGGTFNQTLVLMDGMRINDPLTGHFQSYMPVLPAEIERIEIIRGPGSAQYGPDAVGGVINIVTKTFANSNQKGTEARLNGVAGEHALLGGDAAVVAKGERFRGGLGGRYVQSDGHPLPSGEQSDFQIATAGASAGINLGKGWDLAARTGWDQRTFQAQYYYTVSTFDESREQTGRWWNQARVSHQGNRNVTTLDLTWLSSRDSFLFNPAFAANVHRTNLLNANLHHHQTIDSRLSWAAGMQASRRMITSTDRGDHSDDHLGAYTMAYWEPVQGLHLNGSLRLDLDANYGAEVSPQVNVSYETGRMIVRGGAGRAIRAADYTERFVSTGLAGPLSPGRNLGNPDLLAEQSWNFEAGTDVQLSNWLAASATVFHRRGTNLIDYVLTNYDVIPNRDNLTDSASYLFASNLSSLNTTGVELQLRGSYSIAADHLLTGDAGYTFLHLESPDGTLSKYLSNVARQQLSARVQYQGPRLFGGIQGLWRQRDAENAAAIGADLSPTFTVWHVQAGAQIGPVRLSGQVFNLFNEQYADLLGARMPGRWWILNAGIRL